MLLLDESDTLADQDQSGVFSSESEARGADPSGWHCALASSSPSGGATVGPAHPPSCPLPCPLPCPDGYRPNLDISPVKKRGSNPAHTRRNIRRLLKEHQLDPVTKAAQQQELERRKRQEQQWNDLSAAPQLDTPPSDTPTHSR
ncbi:uncharacterized protein LOC143512550 [Brachyhypopomus gauderio]|uniref:uncharacterized protein LOC143512550 n=1 Tax=Brachyhypopomus gauderio TaxID=698409 RepID=UPI004041AB57